MNEPPEPPRTGNLLAGLPSGHEEEVFELLHQIPGGQARIERIVSHGHASPEGFWYDQPQDEWVLVVQGEAVLEFDDGRRRTMRAGDWITLPTHCRHRVASTEPATVWLAVHMGPPSPA